jgi:tetratricopeptide (TPR) repeat protein
MPASHTSQAAALLVDRAWDAYDEGRLQEALSAAARAVEAAGRLADPVLLVRALSAEGQALKSAGDCKAALARYTRILGLAQDPATSSLLDHPDTATAIASAYSEWVDCARFLTSIPVRELFRVLDEGQRWLTVTGHRDWSASLLLMRAYLHSSLGQHDAAIAAAQEALTLKLRHPEAAGYRMPCYHWALGDALLKGGRASEAAELYEAALTAVDAIVWDQCAAHGGLAECAMAAGDPVRAVREARLAVQLSETLGDDWHAYYLATLARASRAAGELEAGWQAASRAMDAAARTDDHYRFYRAALAAADIALDRGDLRAAGQLLDELDNLVVAFDAAVGVTLHATEAAARRDRYVLLTREVS